MPAANDRERSPPLEPMRQAAIATGDEPQIGRPEIAMIVAAPELSGLAPPPRVAKTRPLSLVVPR